MILIYKITNKVNGKMYVGQTKQKLRARFSQHVNSRGCHKIHHAIKKYGADNFTIESVAEAYTALEADQLETHFINKWDTVNKGYNIRFGGQRVGRDNPQTIKKMVAALKRRVVTPETRLKLSLGKLGPKNPFFGKSHSPEVAAQMMARLVGNTYRRGKKYPATPKVLAALGRRLRGSSGRFIKMPLTPFAESEDKT